MSKYKPSALAFALAKLTSRKIGLAVTLTAGAKGLWVIEVRGEQKDGMPLEQYYVSRNTEAVAYLYGLQAGANMRGG